MDDLRVQRAIRLICSGADGVQAARAVGVKWPTLSSALRERGLSVTEMKAERDKANVSALADAGATTEAITQRLGLPRRFVTNMCAELGLEVENEQARRRRLRRERVTDLHRGGMVHKDIALRLDMNLAVVYAVLRDRDDHLAAKVRSMYERDGLPLRVVAIRLRIGLDEARQYLRQAHPSAQERDPMPTEFKRGAAGDAARAAAG